MVVSYFMHMGLNLHCALYSVKHALEHIIHAFVPIYHMDTEIHRIGVDDME